MTPDRTNLLIDHLDESLRGKATASLEDIIGNDPEAEREWNYLCLAVDAVKDAGLNQQVAAARSAWKADLAMSASSTIATAAGTNSTAKPSGAPVRTLYRYTLRAAACILIVAGSAAIYKYVSVNSSSLYDRYYTAYNLNTARGAGD